MTSKLAHASCKGFQYDQSNMNIHCFIINTEVMNFNG